MTLSTAEQIIVQFRALGYAARWHPVGTDDFVVLVDDASGIPGLIVQTPEESEPVLAELKARTEKEVIHD